MEILEKSKYHEHSPRVPSQSVVCARRLLDDQDSWNIYLFMMFECTIYHKFDGRFFKKNVSIVISRALRDSLKIIS